MKSILPLALLVLSVVVLCPDFGNAHDGISPLARGITVRRRTRAERAWQSFYTRFSTAVRKRDRTSLRRMMSPQFLYSFGGNLDRDEALRYWDDPDTGAWKAFAAVLERGTVSRENTDEEGRPVPSRVAPPAAKREAYVGWRAYFEYGKDGRWRCTGFVRGD